MGIRVGAVFAKAVQTAVVRVFAILTSFLVTILATRGLGAEQAGYFLLGFTLVTALSTFLRLGLDNVLVRAFGADGMSKEPLNTFAYALRWAAVVACAAGVLGCVFSSAIALHVFGKPEFADALFWMMLALPLVVLFNLCSFAFQGLHRVVAATWFQQLGAGFVFVLLFALVWWQQPSWLSSGNAALLFFVAALLVSVMAVVLWMRQKESSIPALGGKWKNAELWESSSNLWAAASMSLLVQWSGVLIAGALIASSELAHLSAAQRTANITSFVLMVVNMAVAPRYARLWKEQKLDELRQLARISTRAMIAMVLPVVAIMLVFPGFILGLFGEGFEQGALLLSIMAIGQFINVATGSVGYLLNMSGHEKDMRRVTMFAGPLTIILAFVLTSEFGAVGAAAATAIGVSVQNLGALAMVKRRLGFWPIG
ncbi:oligosaccharide flippase family protein [Oceanobacter kriegii]|uniref:oligosaccharide flippase family protein n=1 Tax=Oceanobacter kriegii TaxID=64972 RepID=UPI0004248549|nr:oligosaccharide flippase family protein [Oceanobacter kriegii]